MVVDRICKVSDVDKNQWHNFFWLSTLIDFYCYSLILIDSSQQVSKSKFKAQLGRIKCQDVVSIFVNRPQCSVENLEIIDFYRQITLVILFKNNCSVFTNFST